MWVLAVILIVALLIPVAAILVDSPLGRSVARRLEGGAGGGGGSGPPPELRALRGRGEGRETETENRTRSIAGMRDEVQFVQRLLEDPHRKKPTS